MAVGSVLDPSAANTEMQSQLAKQDPNTQVSTANKRILGAIGTGMSGYRMYKTGLPKLKEGLAKLTGPSDTITKVKTPSYTDMASKTPENMSTLANNASYTTPQHGSMTSTETLNQNMYAGTVDSMAETGAEAGTEATSAAEKAGEAGSKAADKAGEGLNMGDLGAALAVVQTVLNGVATIQSYKAYKQAKEQMDKQYDFAVQNYNNQVTTTNNNIDSAFNVRAALTNKTPEEAKEEQQKAQQYHVSKINK